MQFHGLEIVGLKITIFLKIFVCFKTGSYYVAQIGFDLCTSYLSLLNTKKSKGMIGTREGDNVNKGRQEAKEEYTQHILGSYMKRGNTFSKNHKICGKVY